MSRVVVLALFAALAAACVVQPSSVSCVSDAECTGGQVCSSFGVCVDGDAQIAGTETAPCSGVDGCELPEIALREVIAEAGAMIVVGEVVAPGTRELIEAGACALPEGGGEPMCASGPVETVLSEGIRIAPLAADTEYEVSLWVATGADRVTTPIREVATLADDPVGLVASDGTDVDAVELVWAPVDGARAYLVVRDGAEIARVETPAYRDTTAAAGGPPGAPVVQASDGTNPLAIDLQWTAGAVSPGRAHEYAVRTVGEHSVSELSAPDSGFRAGEPPTRFEVRRLPDGDWVERRSGRWSDADVPIREHRWAPLLASRGTRLDGIEIAGQLPELEPPELTTYQVRAFNRYGQSPAASDSGYRGVGPALVELQVTRHEWNQEAYFDGRIGDPQLLPSPETLYRPPEVGRTYTFHLRAQQLGARASLSRVAIGYAAECLDDAACVTPEVCSRGICTLPGYVPFFAAIGPRGAPDSDTFRQSDETFGTMELRQDYDLLATEVTQAMWRDRMGANPSHAFVCGDTCPVENITWWSALAYANAESAAWGLEPCYALPDNCVGHAADGTLVCASPPTVLAEGGSVYQCEGFRLPTSSEWELAAMGFGPDGPWAGIGTPERYDCDASDAAWAALANYCVTSVLPDDVCATYGEDAPCAGPRPVAAGTASSWGLYDTIGNVAEWTWDEYRAPPFWFYAVDFPAPNPAFVWTGRDIEVRGGFYGEAPPVLRPARRDRRPADYRGADVGLRLARTRR